MRKADYDLYYEYIEVKPNHVESMREIELELSQSLFKCLPSPNGIQYLEGCNQAWRLTSDGG